MLMLLHKSNTYDRIFRKFIAKENNAEFSLRICAPGFNKTFILNIYHVKLNDISNSE